MAFVKSLVVGGLLVTLFSGAPSAVAQVECTPTDTPCWQGIACDALAGIVGDYLVLHEDFKLDGLPCVGQGFVEAWLSFYSDCLGHNLAYPGQPAEWSTEFSVYSISGFYISEESLVHTATQVADAAIPEAASDPDAIAADHKEAEMTNQVNGPGGYGTAPAWAEYWWYDADYATRIVTGTASGSSHVSAQSTENLLHSGADSIAGSEEFTCWSNSALNPPGQTLVDKNNH